MRAVFFRFFSSAFSFCLIKATINEKISFTGVLQVLQVSFLCVWNPAFGLLHIAHKSEKLQ